MSLIKINNLTFGYDSTAENVFENVSINIDTDWKLGLIGGNGKGKTTLLKLLLDEYEYKGTITKNVDFDYFPFDLENSGKMAIEIINEIAPNAKEYEIFKEINLLKADIEILYKSFNILSGGEQVKILLASLFLKQNNFLLIDEPTNHLDSDTKECLIDYLKKKKSYIIVSHDRDFLDNVVDHIISINNTNIEIQKGNFSSWQENKYKKDKFNLTQNERIQKDIKRLEVASRNTASWSEKVEKTKYDGECLDRGYTGHKSAKMMKRAKSIERRIENAIEQKSGLLNDIQKEENLKIVHIENVRNSLVIADNLQIKYDGKTIFKKLSFDVNNGDRVAIVGANGIGKSSILKAIIGEKIEYDGKLKIINDLKISYVPQNTDNLNGSLKGYINDNDINESIFKAMLSKMGFSTSDFDKDINNMSEGQKKKVLIAKSISEQANIYIWDEPLNYIDILTRIQIEEAIIKCKPTMIFIEHDKSFIKNISTKIVCLNKS